MSAIVVFQQRGAVHVISDSGVFLPGGTFLYNATKLVTIPHLSCVIACRGPALAPAIFSTYLSAATRSFAHMKAVAADRIREAANEFSGVFQLNPAGDLFDVVIAGVDEESTPDAFVISNHEQTGFLPFTPVPLGDVAVLGTDPHINQAILQDLPDDLSDRAFDPAAQGLRVLELIRQCSRDGCDVPPRVGGVAQICSVTPTSIWQRVMKRWDDTTPAIVERMVTA